MKKKYYIIILMVIFIISYKVYKVVGNSASNDKEIVTIYMKNNEIKYGIEDAVKDFNEKNEDINIKLVLTNDDYNNLVFTNLANENGIDIFEYNGRTLLDKNFIKPLESIGIDLTNVNEEDFLWVNDEAYGIKYGLAMEKLMYSLDLFEKYNIEIEEYPKTLDELIALLEKVEEKTGEPPLNLSLTNIHEVFSILGGMAISENTTYPTFWNYKTSQYEFDGLTEVMEKLNYMYSNNLINYDFDTIIYSDLYDRLQNSEVFVMPINYYEKNNLRKYYFDSNVEFTNIPKVSESDKNYYYTYSRTFVLANNNKDLEGLNEEEIEKINKHNEAVKYVFEWLISENTVGRLNEMDSNFSTLSDYNKEDKYLNLSNDDGYLQSYKDPTEVLAGDSSIIMKSVIGMIKGEIDINEGISKLNEDVNAFIRNNKRNSDIDLSKYKE